jgi:DNA-directed RNA polymerase subunit RPC12/RpoP
VGNRFASGKNAISECDRCGQRFKLKVLKTEIIKTKNYNLLVCPECWDPDHPQLQLGMYPVDDPQALRNPRPDRSYVISGLLADGYNGGGSRIFQWGWAPVGGSSSFDAALTPNNLALVVQLGTVSVVTT